MNIVSAVAVQSPVSVAQTPASSAPDDGLTLAEVIQSLPVDPASIVALLLLVAFVASVVWFGTRGGGGGSTDSTTRPGSGIGGGAASGST
jgi:hypothetical protein